MGSEMNKSTLTQQVNAALATLTDDIRSNKLELPSPPDILIKVRTIANDEQSTADDIAELIIQDAHISGRLIKVANCALFGERYHVTSVKAAVARLGIAKVQNLIIGLSIAQNLMQSKTRGLESFFEHSWQQSNTVAAISYVLAQKTTDIDPEQALLAGMVHNIGTLPLLLRLNKIPELNINSKVLMLVADVVIPKLYPSAGKLVMESWNFSPDIINIAKSHCDFDRDSQQSINLDDIVFMAHQLSLAGDDPLPEELTKHVIFQKFWSTPELANSELESLKQNIDEIKNDISN
ncbi:hypothetical protein A9Q78_10710 [Methylophaga sp. 41_12_T18]|nr:hypothetical protein A9Q78_10710 [Methylophaga sp. 41_12_T18]